MFDDYSIAAAFRSHAFCTPISLDDEVSPTSSRSASPEPDDCLFQQSLDPRSMTKLSYLLQRHTLQSSDDSLYPFNLEGSVAPLSDPSAKPLPPRPSPRLRPTQSAQRQRRERGYGIHHRRSSTCLSRISTMVDELRQNRDSAAMSAHLFEYSSSPLSPTSDPAPYDRELAPSSCNSEDSGSDYHEPHKKYSIYKIGKNLTQFSSGVEPPAGKQRLVLKKTRIRRNAISLGVTRTGNAWRISHDQQ